MEQFCVKKGRLAVQKELCSSAPEPIFRALHQIDEPPWEHSHFFNQESKRRGVQYFSDMESILTY